MPMKGHKQHIARLKRLSGPTMEREIGKALFAAGKAIAIEAQISITTGAMSGKDHVPSLPGEPPMNDTGYLANNIEAVQVSSRLVEVSSNAEYAAALEFGTSRMAARPYMAPARDKKRPEVERLIADAVRRVVRR